MALVATAMCLATANGSTVLLAGFDGNQTENNASNPKTLVNPLQDSSAAGKVTVSLSTTNTLVSPGFDWAAGFQSAVNYWGSNTAFNSPAANTANNNAVYAHDTNATITLTVINSGTGDVALDSLLMRVKRDNATGSATGIRVTYVSGDLSNTPGSNYLFALNAAASTVGYNFALSNLISDFTLSAGQSATFTWASEGGTGSRTRFDNIALTGTVVPEPSAALLGSLGVLALLRRRR
jgi:hypothetical protein